MAMFIFLTGTTRAGLISAYSAPGRIIGRIAVFGVYAGAADFFFLAIDSIAMDFLHLHHWPVFNVADSCITIGAGMLAWGLFGEILPTTGIAGAVLLIVSIFLLSVGKQK